MDTKEGAEEILRRIETVYVPKHKYAIVEPREFKHLDLAYYDKVQRYLESQGFNLICNKEYLTISEAPGGMFHRVLIRVLASSDGQISATIYHPKIRSLWLRILLFVLGKRLGRVVDFESEYSDGTFICTTNAMSAGAMSLPKQISSEFLHRDTPVEKLLARHREKLETRPKATGVSHRLVRSYDENIAMQNRMNALKSAYRGEIGGITKEELDRISPNHPDLTAEVHQEIKKLQSEKTYQAQ